MCVKVPGRDKQSPQVLHRADDDAVSYRRPSGVRGGYDYSKLIKIHPKVLSEPHDKYLCDPSDLFYQSADVGFFCFLRLWRLFSFGFRGLFLFPVPLRERGFQLSEKVF